MTKRIPWFVAGIIIGLLIGIAAQRRVAAGTSSSAPSPAAQTHGPGDGHNHGAPSTDWCVEHRVPESACTKCHPELAAAFMAKGDWCREHGVPESHCRLCQPGLIFAQEPVVKLDSLVDYHPSVFFPANSRDCATNDAVIQFASVETVSRAGLGVVPAVSATETEAVEAPAEIVFDETKSYAVAITLPTSVVRWLVEPGQRVSAGQAIAEMESPDMPRLQAEYLAAVAEARVMEGDLSRGRGLREKALLSEAEFQRIQSDDVAARTRLAGARGMLAAAGLNGQDLDKLADEQVVSSRWAFRIGVAGSVLDRKAPLGELLPVGASLAAVGDPTALWIVADVRESDIGNFHPGQTVDFLPDDGPFDRVAGRVTWVAQFVDPHTRAATVRAVVTRPSPELRAHRYGRLSLSQPVAKATVAVPRDAVQWEGCCNVVFVQEAESRFRPRKVTLVKGDPGYYNVTSGLRPGERVVVDGSFLLKTELKRSSLGIGCCAIDSKS